MTISPERVEFLRSHKLPVWDDEWEALRDRNPEEYSRAISKSMGLTMQAEHFRTYGTHDQPPKMLNQKNKKKVRRMLLHSQKDCCANQHCWRDLDDSNTCIDHKVPKSRGGTHAFDNLHLLCADCNNRKGRFTWEEFCDMEDERYYKDRGY